MPPGTEINQNPNCVEYDDSLIPDCGVFIVDDVTSYYHIHEYSMIFFSFFVYKNLKFLKKFTKKICRL